MDLREFNPAAQRRKSYFEGRGYEAPPLEQEERFHKAVSFMNGDSADYEACIALYDPLEDYNCTSFLNLLGFLYAKKDLPIFDDAQAIEYFWRGLHFAVTEEQKVYAANGLLNSYFSLYNIEPKDFHELHRQPRILHAMQTLINAGEEPNVFAMRGNLYSRKIMSEFYGAGLGVERDLEKSQDLNWNYRWQQDEERYQGWGYYHTDYILALKAVLGIGREQSGNLAAFILQTRKSQKNELDVFEGRIFDYIKKRGNSAYNSAAQKLMDVFSQNQNPFSLIKVIRDASQDELEAMTDTLYFLKHVACWENWPERDGFINMYLTAFSALKPHPVTQSNALPDMSVYSNTYKYGPFYNRLDEHSVPIWGDLEASFKGSDHDKQGRRIPAGWRAFSGLSTDMNRNINFEFERSLFKPAMIFQEDLDVILALIYGSDTPMLPNLGLYITGSGTHPHPDMEVKGFTPDWLTVTDLGKTFYICDYLSGMLTFRSRWSIENFPISDGKNKRLEGMGRALKTMIADIKGDEKPKHPKGEHGYSAILNNNPEFVGFTDMPARDGTYNLKINKVLMRIEGGFVDEEKMRETSGKAKPEVTAWEFRNDPAYQHTRITKTLTDYYDVIAEVMPVYERLRQLMGIINLVYSLRLEKGFMPNQKVQEKAREDLEFFANKYEKLGMQTEYIRNPLHQSLQMVMS